MKYLNDVNYKGCVDKVCQSNLSGDFKIVKYNDWENVEIQFLKTGYEMTARLDHIRNGSVKDPYLPSVYGVGITGTKYPSAIKIVLKQKSITCGRVCCRGVILILLKRNTQLTKVVK